MAKIGRRVTYSAKHGEEVIWPDVPVVANTG